jgi:hypothetical protein
VLYELFLNYIMHTLIQKKRSINVTTVGGSDKVIMKPRMVLNNLKGCQQNMTVPRSSTFLNINLKVITKPALDMFLQYIP